MHLLPQVGHHLPFPQAQYWGLPTSEPLGMAGFTATIGPFSGPNRWGFPTIRSRAGGLYSRCIREAPKPRFAPSRTGVRRDGAVIELRFVKGRHELLSARRLFLGLPPAHSGVD
jgi:hypothetical protein